jgi:glycosyltransferase involved in cell wall biosynthesis
MNKKILMILQSEFPPDIRLEKEIRALNKAGFKVVLFCNSYSKENEKDFPFCEIKRLSAPFRSRKLNKVINFPIIINPRFVFRLLYTAKSFNPDFIHAHDLPMTPFGLLISKILKKPIIIDMHENYPAALKAFQKKGILNFLFKNYRAAKVLEKFCVRRVDRIITVIDENSQRVIELGATPENVYLVSNTVDLDTFAVKSVNQSIMKKYKGTIILLYTGFVSPERGLDIVVEGMKYLKDKLPAAKLLIVGDGITVPELQSIVNKNNLKDCVEFISWPGHENLGTYIEIADIGISPQPNNEHWNTSIPHKLFEYMSKSIPVLVTDAMPLKRIILETNAGLFYKTDDPEDFANKIIELQKSSITFGENGLKAVREKYNWEKDSKTLIEMYNKLAL